MKSELYQDLRAKFSSDGDSGFCVPLAVAVLLPNEDPERIRKAFEEAGRKKGCGVSLAKLQPALRSLGYSLIRVDVPSLIETYPGVHKKLRSVTSHHPERFPESFRGRNFLFWGRSHSWASRGEVNHDWTKGRSFRAYSLFEIILKAPFEEGGKIYGETDLKMNLAFDWKNRRWR